jgi:hypothetical protein
MERKHFLKSLLMGAASAPSLPTVCGGKDDVAPATGTTTGTTNCTVAPTETEGPFPTHTPSSYVRSNITDGRPGYALTAKITITSSTSSRAALAWSISGTATPRATTWSTAAPACKALTTPAYTFCAAAKPPIRRAWARLPASFPAGIRGAPRTSTCTSTTPAAPPSRSPKSPFPRASAAR